MARQVGDDASEASLAWGGGDHASKATTVVQGKGNIDKGRSAWIGGRVRSNANEPSTIRCGEEGVTNEASSSCQGE